MPGRDSNRKPREFKPFIQLYPFPDHFDPVSRIVQNVLELQVHMSHRRTTEMTY